jgi:membrane-bound ClpP family serine protease
MNPIILIFLFIAVGIVLFIAEMMLPTHGVLSIAGVLCFGCAIVVLFRANQWIGLTIFLAAIVTSPVLFSLGVKLWTKSPVGRRIVLPPVQTIRAPESIALGQIGVAVTDLRPAGECDFGDQRMRAVSQFGEIRSGEKVKIIAIDNGRPTVRTIET